MVREDLELGRHDQFLLVDEEEMCFIMDGLARHMIFPQSVGQMQIPFHVVFTNYAFNDLQQVFVCGLGQVISLCVVCKRHRENDVIFLENAKNLF